MDWYRQFLKRFGFAGFLLTLLVTAYVVLLILLGVLGEERFGVFWSQLTLPADLSIAVQQPWTLFTYWLGNHPLSFWFLLVDLAILYGFGHILNAMIGDRRMQGLVAIAILVNGLATIGLSNLLPTVETTSSTRLFGFGAVNATIIAAAITLVPRYNFRILVWDIPLIFVGLFILATSVFSHRLIFTMEGTAELIGAGLGFALIKTMRSGWDLANWFRGAANRPSVKPPRQPEPVMSTQRPVVRAVNPKQKPSNQQQPMTEAEELDFLLDKINDVGYSGLTQAEKERLDLLSGK
jgi:membrane associated rhomboid family serine protease